ncbi:MAG: glycosyltransferase [Gemmataceae bacterium]
MSNIVVFAGSIAQKPKQGGLTWVFLQYLLGFRRLGWEVLFLDRLEPGMCVDSAGQPCSFDKSLNLHYFLEIMEGFDLAGSFSLNYNQGECVLGLPRNDVLERTRNSALLINVMGFLNDEEVLRQTPMRVFLDIDPGFGQMWHDLGLSKVFYGHDAYVTIGLNIGRPGSEIPLCGLRWITTLQPIVLDYWKPVPVSRGESFTSVASWRGDYGPVEYQGKTYGLRVHEFRKFAPLPRLCNRPFELALDIHQADVKDRALLDASGWSVVPPTAVAGDPWAYQAYVQGSKAEFMVAKNMYVQSQSGWFSDRSICYLASGKPVLAQDTGLKDLIPTGEGLLTFTTLKEAVAGAEEISGNYLRHARAARCIAEEIFDSDKVLGRLLSKLAVA